MISKRIIIVGLLLTIVQYTNAEQQQQPQSSRIQQPQSPQHNSLRGSRSQSQNTSISKIQLESLIDKPDFEGEERLMKALTSKSKVYVSLLGDYQQWDILVLRYPEEEDGPISLSIEREICGGIKALLPYYIKQILRRLCCNTRRAYESVRLTGCCFGV